MARLRIEIDTTLGYVELTVCISKNTIVKDWNDKELYIGNLSKTTLKKLSNLFYCMGLLIDSNEACGYIIANNADRNIYAIPY